MEGVDCVGIESKGKNTCAIDYIWTVVKGGYGFSGMSYGSLKRDLNFTEEGLSTDDVITWRNKSHKNVGDHVSDPLYKLFVSEPAS